MVCGLRTAVVAVTGVRIENPCKHNISQNLTRRPYITNVEYINLVIFQYYTPTLIGVREIFFRGPREPCHGELFSQGTSPFCKVV